MKIPSFRTSLSAKSCDRAHRFFEHWFVKYVVLPVFVVIPTTFILIALTNANLFKTLQTLVGPDLSKYLIESQFVVVAIIYILWKLGGVLFNLVKHCAQPDSELSREDILTILDAVNIVVSAKRDRFLEETKVAQDEQWTNGDIFKKITKPEQQISLLVHAVKTVFELILKNNVGFRVGLMAVEKEILTDWFAFSPKEHPPTTGPDTLSSPSSTVMRALKSKRMVVVSDVAKELKKRNKKDRCFVKGNFTDKDQGAILALPIICPNTKEPVYVLSIFGDKALCLEEKRHELYAWVLDQFISRLILEHHLMLMKQAAK